MNDQLTLNDLRAYRAGQLSAAARHRVERLLLDSPFYADALDGLEALHQQATRSLPDQTDELRLALHRRIRSAAHRRRLMRLWFTTTVAAILLALVVATYLIFTTKRAGPGIRKPAQSSGKPGREPRRILAPAKTAKTFDRAGRCQVNQLTV